MIIRRAGRVISAAAGAEDSTVWYVSATGDAGNSGHSTGAAITYAALSGKTLEAGDAVLFKRGDTFTGQYTIAQSGSEGSQIVFGAYGTGDAPIISGGESLSGSWVVRGAYRAIKADTTIHNLWADNVQQVIARKPNSGFYAIASGSTTALTSVSLDQANDYWNGATVRYKGQQYAWIGTVVADFASGELTFCREVPYAASSDYQFYIDNLQTEVDTTDEWYCSSADSVFFYGDTTKAIVGSAYAYGFYNNGQDFITIRDLDFRYQYKSAIEFAGTTTNIQIKNCTIRYQKGHGIYASVLNSSHIDSCTITDANLKGIRLISCTTDSIRFNTIHRIGLTLGYDTVGTYENSGLTMEGGATNYVAHNRIDSTGGTGIVCDAQTSILEMNYLSYQCMSLNDAGSIYCYAASLADTVHGSHNTIRKNIVTDLVGGTMGEASPYRNVYAIYNDGWTRVNEIDSNTVLRGPVSAGANASIYLQRMSHGHTVTDNVVYDGHAYGLYVLVDSVNSGAGEHTITGNVIESDFIGLYLYNWNTVFPNVGTIDLNYYLNPDDALVRYHSDTDDDDYTSLATWIAAHNKDSNSAETTTVEDTLFINYADTVATMNAGADTFLTLAGDTVKTSFSLPPRCSRVLLKYTAPEAPEESPNIIDYDPAAKNGGFETGDFTSWTDNYVGGDGHLDVVSDTVHGGTKAARLLIDAAGSETVLMGQDVLEIGVNYTLKFWGKKNSTTARIRIDMGTYTGSLYELTNDWAEYTVTGTCGTDTIFELRLYPDANARAFIDDIRLYVTP